MFNFKENKEQILQILKLKFNSIFNILIKFTTNIRVNYTRFSKTIDCFILYPQMSNSWVYLRKSISV